MKISILNYANKNETLESKNTLLFKFKLLFCRTSVWKCFIFLLVFTLLLLLIYSSNTFTKEVLLWLETQESIIVYLVILTLFILVSFPIAVGYIGIVMVSGYLFGIVIALVLCVVGANLGILVAHNIIRLVGYKGGMKSLTNNNTAMAIIRVLSGPYSYKIVFFARLTPIPFGIQNTIFSFTNVDNKVYHLTSLVGLLPGQLIGIYAGSSLRSIHNVFDSQQISMYTYFLAFIQFLFAGGLMIWFGTKARKELARIIAEAENKFVKSKSFDIV